ncbi:prostaglandin reductase 1-like [Cylas formicarius]|uniref:prostaglandin reductase 1-like n=1 Tax=Cylas formicarius TaxID=197179 RepID=UPI002958903B|nr:prostaglandin reductase 1-like [Cylas formicarius]
MNNHKLAHIGISSNIRAACASKLSYISTIMVRAKHFVYKKHFDGFPKDGDLVLEEEELPAIKDGEFLAEAVYLSVDPYMRKYAPWQPLNKTFYGRQIAVIKDSKNSKFPKGQHVLASFGWRSHTISDGVSKDPFPIKILPDYGGLPLSLGLGVLGHTGHTAYIGFLEISQPKVGETVVVSGAAGAVGSIVGQIAKIKGCKVIGIAGSDKKGKWLTEELKFDRFINYKTQDVKTTLQEFAPEGVDYYFDNVGGEISSTVIYQLNPHGRVSACGSISEYNDGGQKVTPIYFPLVAKELKIEGFQSRSWYHRWDEAVAQNLKWIQEGKLKYNETVTEGFENMFVAFTDMLRGGNIGKAIVKA